MRRTVSRRTASLAIAAGAVVALVAAQLLFRMVPIPGPGPMPSASIALSSAGRSIDFDSGWRFKLVNRTDTADPTGQFGNASNPLASAVSFDDSSWQSVTVPYDWSVQLKPQATGVSNATGYFQGGLGWFRKTFTLPPSMTGKTISLDFDGIYMDSWLYLNGKSIGNHAYGYTGFSLDVSKAVHTDGATPNVLAVVVQSKQPNSRWYSGSGITRNVRLTVTDPIHLTRAGVFVTTPSLETDYKSGFATVHAAVDAQDDSGAGSTVQVKASVVDSGGNVVATSTSGPVGLGGRPTGTALDFKVDHPYLWSTSDPYLYSLAVDVIKDGAAVDTLTTTFGIRWLQFDPNTGLHINGLSTKLQGVDLHNDQGALGSVNNSDALVRQLTILKQMGVNSLRTSHNPPSLEFLAACDRLGLLVIDEAFDTWSKAKLKYDYSVNFKSWADSDIGEMVLEGRNSPSVMMWSIGNEIPGFTDMSSVVTAKQLIDDIHSLDTTRPVVAASDQYRSLPKTGSGADQVLSELDGLGLNYESAQGLDGLHAMYPSKFFFQSESSSSESSRGAYQDPQSLNTGVNYTPGKQAASSYDNTLASWTTSAEYALKGDRDRPFDLGQFLWSGFDYIGEPTPYNVFPVKASFFGAVDTAGLPKDEYYLFQSQWTTAPMVHLVPMDWTDHKPGDMVQVWAYSNVDSIELTLNGVSLGTKKFDQKTTADGKPYLETTEATSDDKNAAGGSYTSPNGSSGKLHLTWDVPFAPGKLVAVARKNGEVVAQDEVSTAGAPAGLRLTPNNVVIPNDGKSLSYVEVDVVDSAGVVVPSADDLVSLTVNGGTFHGADNGRQESAEGYKDTSHTAYNGKLVAIVGSTTTPSPITVTARAAGLPPATVTIYSSNATGKGLVALAPAYLRAALGTPIALPATVQGVHADGSQEALAVHWNDPPAATSTVPGTYKVTGTVSGSSLPAEADVTAYAVAGVQTYSTVIVRGALPRLPGSIRVVYTDGVDAYVQVQWQAIDPTNYQKVGVVTVSGTVPGTTTPAVASVRIAEPSGPRENLALGSGPFRPVADASFSGSPTTLPAGMLDGDTSQGGWSNFYATDPTALLPGFSQADAADWVSVTWPNPETFDAIQAFFVADESHVLPSQIGVSVWAGANWVPATHVKVKFGAAGAATTISFDAETASAVRLDMASPTPGTATGFLNVSELQVLGSPVSYHTVVALQSLAVGGVPIAGFSSGNLDYHATADSHVPQISAVPAANGRVLVIPPTALPGVATILVTSEDGTATSTYLVHFDGG